MFVAVGVGRVSLGIGSERGEEEEGKEGREGTYLKKNMTLHGSTRSYMMLKSLTTVFFGCLISNAFVSGIKAQRMEGEGKGKDKGERKTEIKRNKDLPVVSTT